MASPVVTPPPAVAPPVAAPVPAAPSPAAALPSTYTGADNDAARASLAATLASQGLPVPASLTPTGGVPALAAVPPPAPPVPPVVAPPVAPTPNAPATATAPASTEASATPAADDDFQLRDPDDPTLAVAASTEPPPAADGTPAAAPVVEAPATPSAVDQLAALLSNPDSIPDPALLDDKIRGAFLATNSGRRIYSHMKGMAELAKAPDQGGLGVLPTPEQIRNWHASDAAYANLTYQLESGTPEGASAAFQSLFTTASPTDPSQTILRPGLETALPSLFGEIAALSRAANRPELYHRAVAPIHEAKFSALVNHVRSNFPGGAEGSEEQKARDVMIWAMQRLAPLYSQSVTPDTFTVKPTDPQARLAAENASLKQRIASQQQQQVEGRWESFLDGISSAISPRAESYVSQSLAEIKPKYEPAVYSLLSNQFRQEVFTALASDPYYLREADPILNRIRQTGSFLNGHSVDLSKQVAQIQDRHLQRIVTSHRSRFLSALRGEASPRQPQAAPVAAGGVPPAPGATQPLTPAQQQAADAARYASTSQGGTRPTASGGILPPAPAKFTAPIYGDITDAIAADIAAKTGGNFPPARR